jgi:hypothetical protein
MKKKYLFYIILILLTNLNEFNCLKKNNENKLKTNKKHNNNLKQYENINIKNDILKTNRTKRSAIVLFLSLITILVLFLIIENSLDLAFMNKFELNKLNDRISEEKLIKINNILNKSQIININNKELEKEKNTNN